MNFSDYNCDRQKGFSSAGIAVIIFLLACIACFFAYHLFLTSSPVLKGTEAFSVLPAEKTIILQGEHIKSLSISIQQNGKKIDLLTDKPVSKEMTYTLTVKPKALTLSDGPARISIQAEAGLLKKIKQEINTVIDTVPPALEILKVPQVLDQGGTGAAVLRAGDAESVFVKLEEKTFPAFRTQAGSEYYVFFPVPYNKKDSSIFYAVAKDAAGNQNVQALQAATKPALYRSSSITIDESFINTVAASLLNETSISDHESAFKKVNEELRKNAVDKLKDIAKNTEHAMLWDGPFLQLKNSKVMATYGDRRAYIYGGKKISDSVHLGYDLASNAHSPVEAANTGIVKFAGDMSIYGNAVIIDHGLGLMSLYGHLSMIDVREGQQVIKGDIIGKTGSTGLAGGDHLHFGILVHGYEVSPLFWWDNHWIRVNILDQLKG